MRMLTSTEYGTLCRGPEGLAELAPFESVVERGLLAVIYVDPVNGYRFTSITPLGHLAKRIYESIHSVAL